MKSIIPYKKEISFGSKIAEITSMSLEHEIDLNPEEVHGNFIISGDYKSHEVSVNREPFLYKLPFSIELTDHIDLDSFQFEITDFSYDILNDDTVEVDIEFAISAEEMEEESDNVSVISENSVSEEEKEETDLTRLIEMIEPEEVHQEEDILKEVEEENIVVEEQDTKECEERVEPNMIAEEKIVKEDMTESEETIIQNVNPMDDSYATYHIHIVNSGETVETICTMYHSNLGLLSEYNDMSQIAIGDKIIIPKEDE